MANPHRNRTLVLNNKTDARAQDNGGVTPDTRHSNPNAINSVSSEQSQSTNGWVTKRDRHMQLINTSIYDKETQIRNKAIEETRKQKALQKNRREKHKVQMYLEALAPHKGHSAATAMLHEVTMNGLRFQVLDGGSKLARIRSEIFHRFSKSPSSSRPLGATDSASITPKQASIGGVSFLRSKNGNLYRSGIVKAKR